MKTYTRSSVLCAPWVCYETLSFPPLYVARQVAMASSTLHLIHCIESIPASRRCRLLSMVSERIFDEYSTGDVCSDQRVNKTPSRVSMTFVESVLNNHQPVSTIRSLNRRNRRLQAVHPKPSTGRRNAGGRDSWQGRQDGRTRRRVLFQLTGESASEK